MSLATSLDAIQFKKRGFKMRVELSMTWRAVSVTRPWLEERVEREFVMVRHVELPNWPFCRDDLTVWERRGPA